LREYEIATIIAISTAVKSELHSQPWCAITARRAKYSCAILRF